MNLYYESSNELYHHGIKGQKWGRRRFQNSDGSLTAAGRKRYSGGGISGAIRNKQYSNAERDLAKTKSKQKQVDSELRELKGYAKNPTGLANSKISTAIRNKQIRDLEKSKSQLKSREKDNRDAMRELDEIDKAQAQKRAERNTPEAKAARKEKAIKAAKVGAAVAGTALAAYGAYKVHEYVRNENTKIRTKQGENAAHKLFDDMMDERRTLRDRIEAKPQYYTRDRIDNTFDDIDSRYEIRKKAVTNNYKNMAEKDSFKNAAENVLIDKIENRRKRDRFGNLI